MYCVSITHADSEAEYNKYFEKEKMANDFLIGVLIEYLVKEAEVNREVIPKFKTWQEAKSYCDDVFNKYTMHHEIMHMIEEDLGISDIFNIYPPSVNLYKIKPNCKSSIDLSIFKLMQDGYMDKTSLGDEIKKYDWSKKQ